MSYRTEIHDRVLNAENKEELMSAYAEWAARYDSDLLGEWGYVAPVITSKLLAEYLDTKEARVLDAGCGTGIVGQCMSQDGYRNLEGLDYSQDMLEQAKGKGVYQSLNRADLTQRLDMPDDTYDAVISVGTFTLGHVGPEALDELARVTKPGGIVCFTVRDQAWEEDSYRERLRKMETQGLWELVELRNADYIEKEGAGCKVCVYRVA